RPEDSGYGWRGTLARAVSVRNRAHLTRSEGVAIERLDRTDYFSPLLFIYCACPDCCSATSPRNLCRVRKKHSETLKSRVLANCSCSATLGGNPDLKVASPHDTFTTSSWDRDHPMART